MPAPREMIGSRINQSFAASMMTAPPGPDRLHAVLNSSLVIRNVTVDGRRTSVRLEPEMWDALAEIARRERCSLHDLGTLVACRRGTGSLTAAIRVFIMAYYKRAATESGHNSAGHGSGSVLQPLFDKLAQAQPRQRRDY